MAFLAQQPLFKFNSLGKSYHSKYCLAFYTVDMNLDKIFLHLFVKLKKKSIMCFFDYRTLWFFLRF